MQSLIPLILALSLASATPLNLLPYAFLSSPLPVYHQYQNTRTGEHAFSYAGGPSAKEEIKDADGVLRGSYSYVDANGILQSVFYVADDNGFRVAATNLPSDENTNAEASHVILARSAADKNSRKRRSLGDSPIRESQNQQEGPANLPKDDKQATSKALPPILFTNGIPLATSHQSQVQVHSNALLQATEGEVEVKPVDLQPILPPILGGLQVLRAPTYHENRIELHKELGIEGPRPKDAVKIDPQPLAILQSPLPLASTLIARETLPLLPLIAKDAIRILPTAQIGTSSVTTSISSHGISQIHGPSTITKQAVPALTIPTVVAKESIPVTVEKKEANVQAAGIVKEAVPLIPIAKELPTATVTTSISSHGISQIHGGSKVNVEPLLIKAAHVAPIIDVPVYVA